MHGAGERVLGIVLWGGELPPLPTRDEVAAAARRRRRASA
jgi:hypothetical protein